MLSTHEEYTEALASLRLIEEEYERVRNTEEARKKGSKVRTKLIADGQIMNDLREEVALYEVANNLRGAGVMITTTDSNGGSISTEVG